MNSEKLMIAFIEFMFEDIEPKWLSENEQILFDSLRVRMELQKARSDAWSSSHWGWRPKKTTNDESKETTKKQQKNNTSNNKKTTNETTNWTTKKQEDKDKVKDKEEDNNKINISSSSEEESVAWIVEWEIVEENSDLKNLDWEEEKEKSSAKKEKEFWDEEINKCMAIIKSHNSWIINWSEKTWRKYCRNLILKLKSIEKVKQGNITREQVLEMILATAKENEFHSSKTTSPELIYYNLSTLLDVCRNEFKKQQGSITLHAL